MSPTDKEFYAMEADVKTLKRDLGDVKTDVSAIKEDIAEIKEYMASEKGGRVARAELQAAALSKIELSWTKVTALGALIGAISGLPYAFHFVLGH